MFLCAHRQRTQRNLQNTWDDLLARQALEACTAEALAAWAKPDEASAWTNIGRGQSVPDEAAAWSGRLPDQD